MRKHLSNLILTLQAAFNRHRRRARRGTFATLTQAKFSQAGVA